MSWHVKKTETHSPSLWFTHTTSRYTKILTPVRTVLTSVAISSNRCYHAPKQKPYPQNQGKSLRKRFTVLWYNLYHREAQRWTCTCASSGYGINRIKTSANGWRERNVLEIMLFFDIRAFCMHTKNRLAQSWSRITANYYCELSTFKMLRST